MSFRYKFIDLSAEQQKLVRKASEVLTHIPRPINVRSESCHEPELENWNRLQPVQMLTDPDSASDHSIFMLTPDGFVFFFPILLSWMYYGPPGDSYEHQLLDLIDKNFEAIKEVRYHPYFSICYSLMKKCSRLDETIDLLRLYDEEEWSFEGSRYVTSRQKIMLLAYERAINFFESRAELV